MAASPAAKVAAAAAIFGSGVHGVKLSSSAPEQPDPWKFAPDYESVKALPRAQGRLPLAWTACGANVCKEFIRSARSAVAQLILDEANGHDMLARDVYAVVDDACLATMRESKEMLHLTDRVNLTLIGIESLKGVTSTNTDAYAKCAAVRLHMPKLIPASRFLYMDADVRVTESFLSVADTMERNADKAIFWTHEVNPDGCGNECGYYNNRPWARGLKHGPNGHNDGILGVNADVWIQKKLDQRVEQVMNESAACRLFFPFGDQDMLNIIARQDPNISFTMPCEFNYRYDNQCVEVRPQFLHGNHHYFEDGGSWAESASQLNRGATSILYKGAHVDEESGHEGVEHMYDYADLEEDTIPRDSQAARMMTMADETTFRLGYGLVDKDAEEGISRAEWGAQHTGGGMTFNECFDVYDLDKDGYVKQDEWITMWKGIIANTETFVEAQAIGGPPKTPALVARAGHGKPIWDGNMDD